MLALYAELHAHWQISVHVIRISMPDWLLGYEYLVARHRAVWSRVIANFHLHVDHVG